jgi:hypothetical protein
MDGKIYVSVYGRNTCGKFSILTGRSMIAN